MLLKLKKGLKNFCSIDEKSGIVFNALNVNLKVRGLVGGMVGAAHFTSFLPSNDHNLDYI